MEYIQIIKRLLSIASNLNARLKGKTPPLLMKIRFPGDFDNSGQPEQTTQRWSMHLEELVT
jgi:hypothetical protein